MARRKLLAVVRYLQRLTSSENVNGLSDAELLERYVRHRDEAAEIDVANLKQRLLPGMHGKVTIHFKKRFADAFVVPSSCIFLVPLGQQGVCVVRDGKAHRLLVEVLMDNGKEAEISKGINAPDLIITNNPSELAEGTPVTVEKTP